MADAAKTHPLPDGYEDEAAFIREARLRFQQGVDFDRENRDQGLEDLKFLSGEQWDVGAKAARAGRPMLTINVLPQYVAQVVGDIRINRPAIRVRPAEDGDKDLAEIREGLIRAIERDSDAQGVYTNVGTNQTACGIGNYRITLKYASDNGFDRDIAIVAIPNAFAVVWDPMASERTGRDAGWCFVEDQMPRKAYEARYGKTLGSGLEVPLHDTDGWYTQDVVRVTEYWLIKETKTEMALLESGEAVEAKKVPPGVTPKRTRTVSKRSACAYLINGTEILEGPVELPIDRVPIIRAIGWEINVGDKRVRWGLVRPARDSQRLKNYWRSISAEVLALAPKGKWLVNEQNEGDADGFRDAVTTDDPVLSYSGAVAPTFVGPPAVNAAILQESALNAQDIKDVTGLHDASLGSRSNETSGKAILARQKEGDTATYIYPDNLAAAIQEGGRVANQLIPTVYDTARTLRILGEDEAAKVQRVNDPNDPESLGLRDDQGRYDVVVETGPSYSTRRVEAAESMLAFTQAVPAAAQFTGDLIARSQDWPMADEFAERLKKTLPPGLASDNDEELTDEQKAAKAQQMQAAQQQQMMQQRGMQLEMDEREAKAMLAKAQAMKAMREAQAPPPAEDAQEPYAVELALAQLRKANAEADKAEWDAKRASAGLVADMHDVHRKPLDLAHSEADLDAKLNPAAPEMAEAAPDGD
jgi:hypothetical protein